MKSKFKATLGTILLGIFINVISSIIYASINNINIFESFIKIWQIIFDFIMNILNYKVPIWALITCGILFIAIIKFYVCIADNKNIKPEYMNYLSGKYRGIKYVWELKKYYNTIEIENVIPVCDCDGFLTTKDSYKNMHYGSPKLYCVNCDKIIENDFNREVLEDAKLYFTNKLNNLIKEENNKLK